MMFSAHLMWKHIKEEVACYNNLMSTKHKPSFIKLSQQPQKLTSHKKKGRYLVYNKEQTHRDIAIQLSENEV